VNNRRRCFVLGAAWLRDLLLGSASRSNAGTVELLTKLSELEPPEDVAAEQRALVAALQRNLERIRNYEHHLDGVQRFRELAAAWRSSTGFA
jgi:hypothetical protein